MTTDTNVPVCELADRVVSLGGLALQFGRIDRTACWHPDGLMRESDTDHTVMLGWIAPGLASKLYPGQLDVDLVAAYALIHDMAEVYAGDTPTLRITSEERAAKADRENWAIGRLVGEFAPTMPWLVFRLTEYDRQTSPEARFVRAVDKILPKIVHLLDGAKGLIEEGVTVSELRGILDQQAKDIAGYAGEFTELLALRTHLVDRTLALLADRPPGHACTFSVLHPAGTLTDPSDCTICGKPYEDYEYERAVTRARSVLTAARARKGTDHR